MFVTLEGPEGAGKTTLIRTLAVRLRELGREVLVTREPGAGELGQQIRKILLEGGDMPPMSELFLFLADRHNHVTTIIQPALDRGETVLCDRYVDSTVVYQGYGRGLDLAVLRQLNRIATGGLTPDRTLLLDLDVEVGLARIRDKDRMDSQGLDFHQKVRQGFLTESKLEPSRWAVLDASLEPNQLVEKALQELN